MVLDQLNCCSFWRQIGRGHLLVVCSPCPKQPPMLTSSACVARAIGLLCHVAYGGKVESSLLSKALAEAPHLGRNNVGCIVHVTACASDSPRDP